MNADVIVVVTSIRTRLAALKKKMQVISKRTSTVHQPGITKPPSNPNMRGLTPPAVVGTSPR